MVRNSEADAMVEMVSMTLPDIVIVTRQEAASAAAGPQERVDVIPGSQVCPQGSARQALGRAEKGTSCAPTDQ